MSIFGIGVDIVEISRVADSLEKLGDDFAKKILHQREYEQYLGLKTKERFLAKRFAAKEAFSKALGTGIVKDVTLPKIEVVNDLDGKPEIILHHSTRERFENLNLKKCFLSISDEKQYAVAQVVIEK